MIRKLAGKILIIIFTLLYLIGIQFKAGKQLL